MAYLIFVLVNVLSSFVLLEFVDIINGYKLPLSNETDYGNGIGEYRIEEVFFVWKGLGSFHFRAVNFDFSKHSS